jgi:hypothetical protein
MSSPTGVITLFARALFALVLLCLTVPAVAGVWVSMRRRTRKDLESGESLDLDALWQLYKRGEISWDEYLRGKAEGMRALSAVEGARGLIEEAKAERSTNSTLYYDGS